MIFRKEIRLLALVAIAALSACASRPKPVPMQADQAPALPYSNKPSAPVEIDAPKPEPQIAKDDEPIGPQSITITLEQVSRELGVPRDRLESQTKLLVRFLGGYGTPHGLCSDEDEGSTQKLCSLVEMYENNPSVSQQRRSGGRRVPVRPQHFAQQQGMGFGRLVKSLSREPVKRVLVWSPRLLATTGCPRNLSAAALRKLEAGLPSPAVARMMEKLYEHAAACLQPRDEGYEITHLRQGLLRLQSGDKARAKLAFERAALAIDSTDRPRVLYWAGRLQKTAAARTRYWDRLIEEYPLSFHALEVWRHRDQDPLEIFESRPPLSLSRHSDNEGIDNALRWLESLYVSGHTDAGQKLARWLNTKFKDDLPPSTALYVAALKSGRGTPLNTITFLTQQANSNPAILNRQTLKLLFPRPFFELFDKHSPNTETSLILGVARQESGFNPRARSSANAQGLLQLLPSTARILSGQRRNNLYDTETNAKLGAKFLSNLIDRFGSVELALAAYNAGPGRVDEWKSRFPSKDSTLFLDLIPFKETRHYVANIVRNYYWYERLYSSENNASRSLASLGHKGESREGKYQKSDLVAKLVEAHLSSRGRSLASNASGGARGVTKPVADNQEF